jgi:hypothetical protein
MLVAPHNELGIARYLNHLYDSDMSVILFPKAKSSQALKTLRFDGLILLAFAYRGHA